MPWDSAVTGIIIGEQMYLYVGEVHLCGIQFTVHAWVHVFMTVLVCVCVCVCVCGVFESTVQMCERERELHVCNYCEKQMTMHICIP
jgi:hypothetical protein